MPGGDSAKVAYDRYAPIYDEWNAENDYEMWLGGVLLPELEKFGLGRPEWALDVGCGTGRALEPLLDRGWRVVGCDVSAGMLTEAERKFGSRVRLLNLDARSLPSIGTESGGPEGEAFHLILLLNDVVNYLVEDGDLEKVFAGVKRNLSPRGLVVFDANTLRLFQADFASDVYEELSGKDWEWRGLTEGIAPGAIYEARLSGQGIEAHVHRQRHWMRGQVTEALEAAGLRALAVLGQREERGKVLLSDSLDEARDAKSVYIAGHAVSTHP
jgi:SAM-dependent methyltransferase